jgi:hypothetical protein
MEQFRRQSLLLRDGNIVWGHLVQANANLFEPGPHDHPAVTTYSTDPIFDDRPDLLEAIASRLYDLKGTLPDEPAEREWAEIISDDMNRGMGHIVPKSCTHGREARSSSVMVFRKDIPGGYLRQQLFPLLVHTRTAAVMIVSSRYWPPELIRMWIEC